MTLSTWTAEFRVFGFSTIAALLTAGCASSPTAADREAAMPASQEQLVAQMQIVDCLLPGQLRKLGNNTYLTPRRPIKTTAADCNVRGGEYVAYDRADYKTALKVWMPAAQAGDAKAQVSVGEIFEKGLGTEPNYEAAIIWYRKAAEQGNKQGLFNLGTMYEQGLGVPANRVKALNLYRQAWGLPEDSVIFQETARAEQAALKARLNKQVAEKEAQIRALRNQIDSLQTKMAASSRKARASSAENASMSAEIATLKNLVQSLSDSSNEAKQELAALPATESAPVQTAAASEPGEAKLRSPEAQSAAPQVQTLGSSSATRVGDMDFGQYYAVVIGNRSYSRMESLDTPVNDAREVAALLKDKYGFKVQLLVDVDRLVIMKTINDLHGKMGDNDNLLIYYAGHGSLLDAGKRDTGYWLPVNADPPPDDSYWVPNEFITGHLGRLDAKRVLVIADSCYGGLLSSAPGYLMLGKNAGHVSNEYIKYKLPRRSRLLLSSGGDKPVVDSVAGGQHSIFTGELLKILRDNQQILTVPELFTKVQSTVANRSADTNHPQTPELKSIKGAGHEIGDFFFVPRDTATPVAMR